MEEKVPIQALPMPDDVVYCSGRAEKAVRVRQSEAFFGGSIEGSMTACKSARDREFVLGSGGSVDRVVRDHRPHKGPRQGKRRRDQHSPFLPHH